MTMISGNAFAVYNRRFREYLNSLGTHDEFIQEHLDLKTEHTFRVVGNIVQIARHSGLTSNEIQLARIIALVHDIGRFQQFIRYKTFDDRISVNHAELGIQVLRETGFFHDLDEDSCSLVYHAVRNHNVANLDPCLEEKVLYFSKLIRDADKVDIWYILTIRDVVNKILYDNSEEDIYRVPGYILKSYRNGSSVKSATSMNDYRLLRLSWIYDMNFPATFDLVLKRDYISKILTKIPPSSEKDEITGIIYRYVNEKAALHQNASLKT
jgi:hypothetical protein